MEDRSMSSTANVSARTRIESLLDDNSFVEIGALVTARNTDFNMQTKETPADGVITGYGVIDGKLVYVFSQDASVLGGSVGEMHAKKIINIYNLAMKMGAPVIGLLDSAGLRLQEATDGLNAFGRIYLKQTMASGVVPQITAVFGNCGGGLSVIPALSDFTFMESDKAKLFVNSPNAIKGNREDVCNTAGADFQSSKAGLVDFVGSDAEIFESIRELVSMLPSNNEEEADLGSCEDDLNRKCSGIENCVEDSKLAVGNIADDHIVLELKENFAPEMLTAFIRLNGATVGVVANRTKIYDEEMNVTAEFEDKLTVNGCEKAEEFIRFCDAFNIPVLTLTNTTGYEAACKCSEKRLAKATAKLVYAYADATVPKVNLIIGNAFGSAYITMGCKALGTDVVYAWPDAKIAMMDAKNAVSIIYADEIEKADNAAEKIAEKTAEYNEIQSSVNNAASHGYIDSIVEPEETRKYLIGAFEMLYTKKEERPIKKHSTI
jgi:acetyl-CoA carboxylase carboxyltransferase component